MIKHKFFFLTFFLTCFFYTHLKAEEKIVFIDLNFVFNETLFGKDFNNVLKNKSSKINLKIKDFQSKIENEKTDLLNKKNLLNDDDYNKKLKEIDTKIIEYNSIIKQDEEDLNKYKKNVREEFFQNLLPLLQDFSEKNLISLVLKKESILIGKNTLDITNEIVKLFNEKKNKVTIK